MMKKAWLAVLCAVCVAACALPAVAAPRTRDTGSLGVQLGYADHGSTSVAMAGAGTGSIAYDAALMIKVDYDFYENRGARAWNVSAFYTNPDVASKSLTAGASADADIWQLSLNHKWFFANEDRCMCEGWYAGLGLGWERIKVNVTTAGAGSSATDNTIDANVLLGYEWRSGAQFELLWIPDETTYGATLGYRF